MRLGVRLHRCGGLDAAPDGRRPVGGRLRHPAAEICARGPCDIRGRRKRRGGCSAGAPRGRRLSLRGVERQSAGGLSDRVARGATVGSRRVEITFASSGGEGNDRVNTIGLDLRMPCVQSPARRSVRDRFFHVLTVIASSLSKSPGPAATKSGRPGMSSRTTLVEPAPRLGDQERPGGVIPRLQTALEVAVEPPRRDKGEVEGCRADAPQIARHRHDPRDSSEIAGMRRRVVAEPGRQQGSRGRRLGVDREAAAAQPGARLRAPRGTARRSAG